MPPSRRSRGVDDWQPTRALRRAVGLVCLLLIAAVALGRHDLAVLAVPFAVGTVWALRRRPVELPEVTVETAETQTGEGLDVPAVVSVTNPGPADLGPVVISPHVSRWLRLRGGDAVATALPADLAADLDLRFTASRWGRHRLGPVRVQATACDNLLRSRTLVVPAVEIRVHPVNEHFHASDAMPRAAGLAGTHRSRRPGEGGELVGVRKFAPGDRLRRIDWRVSLRTRELHVAATLSDRDADVVLVVDTLHEAGESGGVHGKASVLDISVRGAAGVAEHYLTRGDRVSLLEFGPRHRQLRSASGRLHYRVVQEWLLDTHVIAGLLDVGTWLSRPHQLPTNAVIVVFTPLLDERSAELLARLARAGRFVVAVDTLPPHARPDIDSVWLDTATRLWLLARQNTIEELAEHGVPIVTWRGAGSLDEVLRDISRMAGAARGVPR
ncbi:MAG: DUF58 domain-containing protein [Micromonosporaceae bacterium]